MSEGEADDEFDEVEYLKTRKAYLENKIERLDYEIEEIIPELDRNESWMGNLRKSNLTCRNILEAETVDHEHS